MNPLFFGSSGRQLFGCYHEPRPSTAVRGAALLCPPWGQEYFISHRVLRGLATRLSDAGYHVLRFDYYGTGDSAGERHEGDLQSWVSDASVAADELKEMSGQRTFAVFGVRLGAVVGFRLATLRTDVTSVMMWDPVVDGGDYLQELAAMQIESDRFSINKPRSRIDASGAEELLGMPLAPPMRASIKAVDAAEYSRPTTAKVNVFYSYRLEGRERLHRALQKASTTFHAENMLGQSPWRYDRLFRVGRVPHGVLERLLEVVE